MEDDGTVEGTKRGDEHVGPSVIGRVQVLVHSCLAPYVGVVQKGLWSAGIRGGRGLDGRWHAMHSTLCRNRIRVQKRPGESV